MGKHFAPAPERAAWRHGYAAFVLTLGIALFSLAAAVGLVAALDHKNPLEVFAEPIAPPPQQLFGKDSLRVLVVGLDYDYSASDQEYSTQARSDVIMAVNLDFADGRIYELSIPRDMDAMLPNGQEAKINQAQSDGGIAESEAVVSKWLGIPGFDRYVILRIDTTKDLIDALGGVDVVAKNSDALTGRGPNGPIDYDDTWGHLHIHFKPGLQHMNGSQAVSYARFRHDWCSDPCRIMRQQQVIKAIAERIKGDKVNTLLHVGDLIGVFNRDVQTNFTREEELSLALAYANLSPRDVKTAQVPYVGDKVLPDYGDVIIPDEQAKAKLVRSMLLDPPAPATSTGPSAAALLAPASIRVDVQNGTAVAGLAKRVAAVLRAKGFVVERVGNAPSADIATTQLRVHSAVSFAAQKVRDALGAPADGAEIVSQSADPSSRSDVTIVLGRDLAASLGDGSASQL